MNKGSEKDALLYDSPLDEESKKLRRNCIIGAVLCLFVGITKEMPGKLPLLGIEFDSDAQQGGIFLLLISYAVYSLLHFFAAGMVRFGIWYRTVYLPVEEKRLFSRLPFWDSMPDVPEPVDPSNADQLILEAKWYAKENVERRAALALKFIYLKLIFELIFPVLISIVSIVLVLCRLYF